MTIDSEVSSSTQTCPACGADEVRGIVYGLPGPDLVAAEQRGEVVLGGCMVEDVAPAFECGACAHRWGDFSAG